MPAKKAAKKAAKTRTRKKSPPKKPLPHFTPKANKLELLLKSITEQYGADPTAPGIALSSLPNGKFYVAIRRFHGYAGKNPAVIISTTAPSLLQGMNEITQAWRKHVEKLRFSATEQFLKLAPDHDGGEDDDSLDTPF